LRAKHTETYAAEHRLPNAEASAMGAAAWVMRDPKRWARALRSGRFGRMLGRKRGVIGDVPLPLAKQWTDARDFARPPRQTFRDWWTAEHGGER
jgi:L-lactate dehydrogenase complex protein LldF